MNTDEVMHATFSLRLCHVTPLIPPPIHRWVHDFNDYWLRGHRTIEVLRDLPLPALHSAITTAEGVVDAAVIQEAKILLATQPLHAAMERRDVAGLRTAIAIAEGEAGADGVIIEVSGANDRVKTLYI